ncbi:MAG: multiheme c-type cytochrome [Tepidisphaerales bacterium]
MAARAQAGGDAPRTRRITRGQRLAFVVLTGGIFAVTAAVGGAIGGAGGAIESPVASLVKLGIKFDGAKTCNAAACHGGSEPGVSPHGNNAYTLWNGGDPHRNAYDTLGNEQSRKIASALGIADATTSDSCLSCHATNVPEPLQGKEFAVDEGNSCTTCHGPSERYLTPHATKGWTAQQRQAAGAPDPAYHAKLLTATGLYDTNPLVERADRCASCHLAIDHKLVAAGHPVTYFELDYFSNPNVYTDRHWPDPATPYFHTRQWAAGQIVAVRDSFRQLATRAAAGDIPAIEQAYAQAMGHLRVLKALVDAGGPGGSAVTAGMAARLGDAAALAQAASATAAAAEALYATFNSFSPDRAMTLKTLNAIAADDGLLALGIHGVEQQALGIFALYNAVAVSEKLPEATVNDVMDAIGGLFAPLDKETRGNLAGYADALTAVRGKLPK